MTSMSSSICRRLIEASGRVAAGSVATGFRGCCANATNGSVVATREKKNRDIWYLHYLVTHDPQGSKNRPAAWKALTTRHSPLILTNLRFRALRTRAKLRGVERIDIVLVLFEMLLRLPVQNRNLHLQALQIFAALPVAGFDGVGQS